VRVGDTVITVREVTMKDLQAFTAACSPFLSAFDEAGALAVRDGKQPDDFALFRVLSENGPAFMQAAALVSNAPVEYYERLKPDQFFEVAAKVVEVNGDFFVRALAPALIRFARGVSQIGLMLSEGSLQQVTAQEATSLATSLASSTAS
jgi:hypothetical protein